MRLAAAACGSTTTPVLLPTFVYGTLMAEEVCLRLIGRIPPRRSPAFLPGYVRWSVRDQVFPGIVQGRSVNGVAKNQCVPKKLADEFATPKDFADEVRGDCPLVEGILLDGLTLDDVELFDLFEGDEYERKQVKVLAVDLRSTSNDSYGQMQWVDAQTYVWCATTDATTEKGDDSLELVVGKKWCYDAFRRESLDWYLNSVVGPCRDEIDRRKDGTSENTKYGCSAANGAAAAAAAAALEAEDSGMDSN